MKQLHRRSFVRSLSHTFLGGAAICGVPTALWAQSAKKFYLGPKLRIVIPGNTRTALDNIGRALGDGLVGVGACDEIEYENIDGKGGTLALDAYVKKYNADPNALLIGGMAMLSSIAAYKATVDISRVRPVARLTSESLVVVVAKNSPLASLGDLMARLRAAPKQVSIGGGLVASEDHLLSGLLVRAAGVKLEDVVYTPYSAGFQMIDGITSGKLTVGVSSIGVFSQDLAAGRLRALGISAKKATEGIRSMREQGVDVDLTNWRGVFTGAAVPPARQLALVEGVKAATTYELWDKTLKELHWESSLLTGPGFSGFLDIEQKTIHLMAQLLKLG